MTFDVAVGRLANMIDDEQLAEDLCNWFNVTRFTFKDLVLLRKLALKRQFEAWDCPTCGDRCYLGSPASYDRFQGVLDQDYVSYPGLGIGAADKRCDNCRMRMIGIDYMPEGYHLEQD